VPNKEEIRAPRRGVGEEIFTVYRAELANLLCSQWREDCCFADEPVSSFVGKLVKDRRPVAVLALRCCRKNHVALRQAGVCYKCSPESGSYRRLARARRPVNDNHTILGLLVAVVDQEAFV